MPTAQASASLGGTPENPVLNLVLPSGPKGEPGGWNMGTALGTANLNTITTPGLYHQSEGTNVTTANNYPSISTGQPAYKRGVVEVMSWGGSANHVMQRFTVVGDRSSEAKVLFPRLQYERWFLAGGSPTEWSSWTVIVPQRVDNTAGRAIYTWDDTANREQLVYGDTGERDITSMLSGFTGEVLLRRHGNIVNLHFNSVTPLAASNDAVLLTLPSGFSAGYPDKRYYLPAGISGGMRSFVFSGRVLKVWGALTADIYRSSITYPTSESWPTSLPGVAVGIIPNL